MAGHKQSGTKPDVSQARAELEGSQRPTTPPAPPHPSMAERIPTQSNTGQCADKGDVDRRQWTRPVERWIRAAVRSPTIAQRASNSGPRRFELDIGHMHPLEPSEKPAGALQETELAQASRMGYR